MNRLFVVEGAILLTALACALLARRAAVRAMCVAAILVISFLFCRLYDRTVLHKELSRTECPPGDRPCFRIWLSAQAVAERRLHYDELVLFAANCMLAIVAVVPRRKELRDRIKA